jgi:hypothetical protein
LFSIAGTNFGEDDLIAYIIQRSSVINRYYVTKGSVASNSCSRMTLYKAYIGGEDIGQKIEKPQT